MESSTTAESSTIVSAPKTAPIISAVEAGAVKQGTVEERVVIGIIEAIIARALIGGAVIAGPVIACIARVIGAVGAIAVGHAASQCDPRSHRKNKDRGSHAAVFAHHGDSITPVVLKRTANFMKIRL